MPHPDRIFEQDGSGAVCGRPRCAPDPFVIGMSIAAPGRCPPHPGGALHQDRPELPGEPRLVLSDLAVGKTQADRLVDAENARGFGELESTDAFKSAPLKPGQGRIGRSAVTDQYHLDMHAGGCEGSDHPAEAEGFVVGMGCDYDKSGAGSEVQAGEAAFPAKPMRGRGAPARRRPGGKSGPVAGRGGSHRRPSAASRPSAAKSASAWLCRTYIVRSATRRACGPSSASGAAPSAPPVRVMASSTAA